MGYIIQCINHKRRIRKGNMEAQSLFWLGKSGNISRRKSPHSWDCSGRVSFRRRCYNPENIKYQVLDVRGRLTR